jgi:hypothetical protein
MNQQDLALLLAVLAASTGLTALIGRFTGDAGRDVRFMGVTGALLGGLAAALHVSALA